MEEEQQGLSIQSAIAVLLRRLWWIVIPGLMGPMAAIVISYNVSPVYTSQAFVLVEQPKVSDKFVPPVMNDQLESRLMTLKEQILSRSRLEPIINRLGLYKDPKLSMEDRVERLRAAIEVKALRPEGSNHVPSGFYITASTDDAHTAQDVCSEVLSMFMAENLKIRQQRAAGTTAFLVQQLADSKQQLDARDAKLAEFKRKYIGQLPADEQRNLEILTSTRTRLEAVTQDINQAQQQKLIQESMLAQQLAAHRVSPEAGASPNDLQHELSAAQAQLASLRARYTEGHPDVVKAKKQVEVLQNQLKASKANAEPAPASEDTAQQSPEVTQARVALQLTEQSIQGKRAEQARLDAQVRSLQSSLQLSPAVEEQYKGLTRDYESALQFYNDLLNKKMQSDMATDLERRQEGEQFGVMDAPDLPAKPSFPNRIKFTLAGLGGGLGLGLLLALLMERREDFLRTEESVARVLELPVLVAIGDFKQAEAPALTPAANSRRR
jgi:polysaccharide chain length determinant protein (PEP-CTERM system associated)